jgi:hypothetical protein
MSRSQRIGEYRRNADACEDWAHTVTYPDIQRGLLNIAKHWREMAARLERIENVARDFEGYRHDAVLPSVVENPAALLFDLCLRG